jgi:K+-sensing histidine kinase KdpD
MPQERSVVERLLVNALIAACTGLSTLLADAFTALDMPMPFLTFLPSVAVWCLVDGLLAGVTATALSVLSLWLFLLPPDGFALPDWGDLGHLFVFVSVAALVCWIIEFQRRSNYQLAQENFELGYKVSLLRSFRSPRGSAQR